MHACSEVETEVYPPAPPPPRPQFFSPPFLLAPLLSHSLLTIWGIPPRSHQPPRPPSARSTTQIHHHHRHNHCYYYYRSSFSYPGTRFKSTPARVLRTQRVARVFGRLQFLNGRSVPRPASGSLDMEWAGPAVNTGRSVAGEKRLTARRHSHCCGGARELLVRWWWYRKTAKGPTEAREQAVSRLKGHAPAAKAVLGS